MINGTACHNQNPGPHTGLGPPAVELTATLLGAAAELGVLALTKNHLAAAAASATVGAGASYIIQEMGLSCKVCGTTSTYKDQAINESEPSRVTCSNPACGHFAYMVASYSADHLKAILQQLKETLQPTCLLTKETLDDHSVKLTWHSHNASFASLNDEAVPLDGYKVMYPAQTTTYTLKVMGKYGNGEVHVVAEVAAPEPPPEEHGPVAEPPPQPPPTFTPVEPPQPAVKRTPVTVALNQIVVYEDGSLGTPDWSFNVYLDQTNLITIPKRPFHDNDKKVMRFSGLAGEGVVQGDEIRLRVVGFSFDNHKTAEGWLTLPLDGFSGTVERSVEVAVQENYKKGNFIFYFTVSKR